MAEVSETEGDLLQPLRDYLLWRRKINRRRLGASGHVEDARSIPGQEQARPQKQLVAALT